MLKQLSVFLENKAGPIAGITRALSEAGIALRALSITNTTDFAIPRMHASDIEAAKVALSKENCILASIKWWLWQSPMSRVVWHEL